MATCRLLIDTTLVVKTIYLSFAGEHTKYSIVSPTKHIDFPIEGFDEYPHHYNILVFDGTKSILDGGYREYIINVPKDIMTIANKHTLFRYVDTNGCIESSLPICPECHDTKFVKNVQGSCVQCIGNPPYRHICERCAIQWDVRYEKFKSKYSNY